MLHELLLALSGTAGAIFKAKDHSNELEVRLYVNCFYITISNACWKSNTRLYPDWKVCSVS